MSILTQEQKAKYFANHANLCPFCESADISADSIDVEARECWQRVICNECGEEWQDVYTLSSVETQDELDSEVSRG